MDSEWNVYTDQWLYLSNVKKIDKQTILTKLKQWNAQSINQTKNNVIFDKPWERDNEFNRSDVKGNLHVVYQNGLYIDKSNLKPRLENRICQLALLSNPNFYKKQALGLSNYNNSRSIYLGDDTEAYIHLPRGCFQSLKDKCSRANITIEVDDKRSTGKAINVGYNGTLKQNQEEAIDALLSVDNGILHAATAFGKTVVCCHLITKLKASTLILVQQTTLMEQWQKPIERFVIINEPLPTYQTPKGFIKTRKSCIGLLKSNMDTTTRSIDIASVESIFKDGKFHHRLNDYGCVILDECHHGASATIVQILHEVCAKYVYGVTATIKRYDGKEGVKRLLIGDVIYRYSAKEKALDQGILHMVYPRFTHCVAPTFDDNNKLTMHQYYELVRNDKQQNQFIVNDVIGCIKDKRTPLVLSRFKSHCSELYEALKDKADHVFLLTGNNSRKQQHKILEEMNNVENDEALILIATGSLIGEGFDYPRLDTLIMATPVSFNGVVEQYVGRLNCDYTGKEKVIVYDYIDHHIPVFENMYHKRLKTYKSIGYVPMDGNITHHEVSNAIFDYHTYLDPFLNDVKTAQNEVYVSSPSLSKDSVELFMETITELLLKGVKVHVITYDPDSITYGNANHYMYYQKQLVDKGVLLHLVNENCQRHCVIDGEIVWYGSLNFLGKADIEDNLMRIYSNCVASELLEMTFGNINNGIDLSERYYRSIN